MQEDRWPYIQYTKDDEEHIQLKKSMVNSCVAFIDILGFKNMVENDIDSVIFTLRYIRCFCKSFYRFTTKRSGEKIE